MEQTGIFGMDANFIDSLTSEQLNELQVAKATLDKYGGLYSQWGGGVSKEDMKAHLLAVGERMRREREEHEARISKFK